MYLSVNSLNGTDKQIWYMSQENNYVIKFRNMFIIVFKRGKRLSKQKEKLEVVVNSKFYIHECLKENGMMYTVNILVILYMFLSVF